MGRFQAFPRVIVGMVFGGMVLAVPAAVQAQLPPPGVRPGTVPPGTPATQSPIAMASKQVQDAQLQLNEAKKNYDKARAVVEAKFKTQEDFVKAQKELDAAKADEAAAKAAALAALNARPDYKQLKATKETVELKYRTNPTDTELGNQLITYGTQLRNMETAALAGDQKYAEAKVRNTEAQKQWAALQVQVDEAAKTDQDCVTAVQQYDTANQSLIAAKTGLEQARKADADARAAAAKSRSTTTTPPKSR